MTTIDNNNYELWLLRYAEQELSPKERVEVEQWLAGHPDAAEELALYNALLVLMEQVRLPYSA